MIFGLLSLSHLGLEVWLAILGGFLSLMLSDYTRVSLPCIALVSLLFLPLVASHIPYSVLPVLLFPVLFYVTLRGGVLRYVSGAGIVAMPGGMLALASILPVLVLLPPLYAMVAAGLAFRRIYGSSPSGLDVVSGIGVSLLGVGLVYFGFVVGGAVLLADLASRVIVRMAGLDLGIRLRTYGFIEAFRSLVVMVIVGLSVGVLG